MTVISSRRRLSGQNLCLEYVESFAIYLILKHDIWSSLLADAIELTIKFEKSPTSSSNLRLSLSAQEPLSLIPVMISMSPLLMNLQIILLPAAIFDASKFCPNVLAGVLKRNYDLRCELPPRARWCHGASDLHSL